MSIRKSCSLGLRASIALVVTTLVFSTAARANHNDDDGNCYRTNVESLDFVETGVTGRAQLCVDGAGLKGDMKIVNATTQNAYTVWWVYIDSPVCPGGGFLGCIETFFGEDPLAVFGRMDSGISPHTGRMRFSDRLDDMQINSGSQVWILLFGHGQASEDGRQLARQLLTPEDPTAGAPHLGVNPNGYPVAVAIFETP